MNIDSLIDGVIGREGGFSDHPADRGGATRWGITQAVARAHGYLGDMREFPRDEAVAIYRDAYWERPGIDRVFALAPEIGAKMFDASVNMGPTVAIGFLQRALNVLNRGGSDYADVRGDGQIGDATIAALKAFLKRRKTIGRVIMLKALETLQGHRYLELAEGRPDNEAFLFGWLVNRVG